MNAKAATKQSEGSSTETSLAERIVHARESADLSTAQLARRLGVKTRTLYSWESGTSEPRPNRLVMLAGVLNVTPAWLLGGDGIAPSGGHDELALVHGELRRLKSLYEETGKVIERIESHLESLEGKIAQSG
jgi:transcriptional regulator with XRE-family HTH domain